MTKRIDTEARTESVRLEEQGSDPSTPDSGFASIFVKANEGFYLLLDSGIVSGPMNKRQFVFTIQEDLEINTGTVRIYNRFGEPLTVEEVHAAVRIAPTDASILIDVNENDSTILGSPLAIAAGANEGYSTGASISDTSWAHGNYLTVDVDQIGSGAAGTDLTVTILVR